MHDVAKQRLHVRVGPCPLSDDREAGTTTSPRLASMLPWFMAKTTMVTMKKRGPPPTGKGIQIGERWHPPELAAIDKWIASGGEEMTRGQAIRRLVELGLKSKGK
jgi:hypothetical protein